MAAVFKGNDYLPLKFASVSFYCQVSDTGSVAKKKKHMPKKRKNTYDQKGKNTYMYAQKRKNT
jgi:hypothetical protein